MPKKFKDRLEIAEDFLNISLRIKAFAGLLENYRDPDGEETQLMIQGLGLNLDQLGEEVLSLARVLARSELSS